MAKVKRNGPCTCGSGKKAKRCCHGPITYVDVRIMPLDMTDAAISVLAGHQRDRAASTLRRADLPTRDRPLPPGATARDHHP